MRLSYEEVQRKSRALLDKHGLKDWHVSVENLTKGTYRGGCDGILGCTDLKTKTIRICWSNPSQFRQTLLHEIAHVLRGVPGHDSEWLNIADKLGCTFGHLLPYAKALDSPGKAATN